MTAHCPACKCIIEPTGLHVELGERDRIWRTGRMQDSLSLPCQQTEAAAVMASKGGGFATVEQVLIGFYGPRWVDGDPMHAQRVISNLRANLSKLGLDVIQSRTHGYAIRIENGCDCTLPRVKSDKEPAPPPNLKWPERKLRTIARGLIEGKTQESIGLGFGVSRNAIAGAIKRNRKRIVELQADEARQSMGNR